MNGASGNVKNTWRSWAIALVALGLGVAAMPGLAHAQDLRLAGGLELGWAASARGGRTDTTGFSNMHVALAFPLTRELELELGTGLPLPVLLAITGDVQLRWLPAGLTKTGVSFVAGVHSGWGIATACGGNDDATSAARCPQTYAAQNAPGRGVEAVTGWSVVPIFANVGLGFQLRLSDDIALRLELSYVIGGVIALDDRSSTPIERPHAGPYHGIAGSLAVVFAL